MGDKQAVGKQAHGLARAILGTGEAGKAAGVSPIPLAAPAVSPAIPRLCPPLQPRPARRPRRGSRPDPSREPQGPPGGPTTARRQLPDR